MGSGLAHSLADSWRKASSCGLDELQRMIASVETLPDLCRGEPCA